MAVTAEQLKDMIVLGMREAASLGIQAGAPGVPQGGTHQGGGGWRKQLDLRAFEGMEVYRGGEVEWVDWMWRMKVQLRPTSPMLLELIGMAERTLV